MLPSKVYYMFVGMDLTFALALALAHQPLAFGFLAAAYLLNLIGDHRRGLETEQKGDNNG